MKVRVVVIGGVVLLVVALSVTWWLTGADKPSGNAPPVKAQAAPPTAAIAQAETARPPRVVAPTAPPVVANNEPIQFTPGAETAAAPAAEVPPDPEGIAAQKKAITNNLRQLGSAAAQYMLDRGVTSANYYDLVGAQTDAYIRSISPVMGETYDTLVIHVDDDYLEVTTPNGMVVRYNL